MIFAKTSKGTGAYTYAGELVHQTTDEGESVDYVHGRADQYGMPVIEQVKLTAGTAYIEHDPTTGQPLALRTANGYEAYYIVDGLGSPVQFINQSTVQSTVYEYDPYGAVRTTKETGTAAAQNPYRFVGGTYDRTTGYVKYGQRWYDPAIGRFTTQDPLTFLADPAQGNRYAYAAGDPINNTDPTGMWTAWDTVSTVLTGVALITAIPTGGASLTVAGGIGLALAQTSFVAAVSCGVYDDNAC
ncbi:RHS repeat-associated core domain-containing protein [Streptomyces sp. TRM76323]|uniref:RHS repeat-associated core domain-containing protein n=1 Tax=Streptomyces tamarix TaxID=3078565 RepID=A0ABU3QQG9_9ACTN|nr:RHS repeat-associated core domain-containing protein [Streptomyces tamarix]MDT9684999.1 RHS repeat-associated core domain-containing protein [Streptomyces tamarix]